MDAPSHNHDERQKLAVLAISAVRKSLSTNKAKNCCAMCGNIPPLIQVEFESGLYVVCRRCSLSVKKAERWRAIRNPATS